MLDNTMSTPVRYTTVKNPLADHLIKEWHPTKNAGLDVTRISAGSNRKVWWLNSDCGHEWEATVANRTYGRGCSICSGHTILKGYNDLLTLKPIVASQFHPTKNGDLTVEELLVGSNRKVWWLNQDCGHEWQMKVATRNDHIPCSICDGFITLPGFNDLATTHPKIASEWHPIKNVSIDITSVGAGSGKKVWWIGSVCGHEWQAVINNRTGRHDSCIYCVGSAVLKGFNDLETTNPTLAKEWHPSKNGVLASSDVTNGSGKKVWWQCPEGHEWQASVYTRLNHGCPYCSGRNAIIGVTDLATVNPSVAKEWNLAKNFPITPEGITFASSQKVWWICYKDHEWFATVNDRNRGQGCPTCASSRYVSKAEQEIADFLIDKGLLIQQTNKKLLKGMEVDIYIPAKNFAIEYNGLYWHNEIKLPDTNYHYNKWLKAKNQGIQLVQIWEDEWNKNSEQIKSMLLHKLGLSNQEKVFARKTTVELISKQEIEKFLNENHIQGYASASIYLGLKENGTNVLVSVLGLKKETGNTLNIIRYATNKNVVGGFTKLLKYAENNFKPSRFVTFSDHCVSDGNLYASNGFTKEKELKPDYRYVVRQERKHKFGYRLKKFKDDPNLKWEEGLTERELAALNGIPRIWDAGKTKWVKEVRSV